MTLKPRRDRTFKMRLTTDAAEQLKTRAHQHELSQADLVRLVVFEQSDHIIPDSRKLQAICQQLAGIGNNLNQCQHAINLAQQGGTLTGAQFAAMHKAINQGREAWVEPLAVLRGQLAKFKPKDVPKDDNQSADKLEEVAGN